MKKLIATITVEYNPEEMSLAETVLDISEELYAYPDRVDGKARSIQASQGNYLYSIEEVLSETEPA